MMCVCAYIYIYIYIYIYHVMFYFGESCILVFDLKKFINILIIKLIEEF